MRTLYIDVYFLINFSVDAVALFLAGHLSKVGIRTRRLILGGLIGAAASIVPVFLPDLPVVSFASILLSLILIVLTAGGKIRPVRRVKLGAAFLLSETLIGGIVYFGYGLLDRTLLRVLPADAGGAENRKILYLSILVLLSAAVMKLVLSIFFGQGSLRTAEVMVRVGEREGSFTALVDSGSFLKDPMDQKPVMLMKASAVSKLLPDLPPDLSTDLPAEYRKRVRLIPVSGVNGSRVLFGIRPDVVTLSHGKRTETAAVTIAVDREDGDYFGYVALLPAYLAYDLLG